MPNCFLKQNVFQRQEPSGQQGSQQPQANANPQIPKAEACKEGGEPNAVTPPSRNGAKFFPCLLSQTKTTTPVSFYPNMYLHIPYREVYLGHDAKVVYDIAGHFLVYTVLREHGISTIENDIIGELLYCYSGLGLW